jgi:hypothetical protein
MEFSTGPLIGDARHGQHQPSDRINVVHFASLQERRDRGPRPASTVRSGKQAVLACNGLGPDGTFDDVGRRGGGLSAQSALRRVMVRAALLTTSLA